jgi:hypothetical protein
MGLDPEVVMFEDAFALIGGGVVGAQVRRLQLPFPATCNTKT